MEIYKKIQVVAAMMSMLVSGLVVAGEVDELQMKQLFEPSEAQLSAEANGRIIIYDGITTEEVERAMDEQYDRIDYMMFIRIKNGTFKDDSVDDDGC